MSEISETTRLLRNLKDAGCEEAMIQKYLQLREEGKQQELFRLLSLHRASLLDQVHVSQNMIDCLDHLVYTMKRGQTGSQEMIEWRYHDMEEKMILTKEWDKTFPQSDKVEHSKVTFRNRYGITLAADLYKPKHAEASWRPLPYAGLLAR